jgi:peroxiredoxin
MALHEGDRAPLLPGVPAATGTQVVYFMRTSSCAVCQKHVKKLAEDHPRIRAAGADVVVVVPDGSEQAAVLAARLSAPFPIISSPEAYAAVGLVPKVFGQLQQSGTLVLADGTVRHLRTATVPLRAFDEAAALTAVGAS